METTINITIPDDFRIACEIFDIPQREIIQLIVDRISLPFFFSHPADTQKWATLVFLGHVDNGRPYDETEMEFHKPYMTQVLDVVPHILAEEFGNSNEAEEAARKVVKKWHQAVIARRAAYLINTLPEGQ